MAFPGGSAGKESAYNEGDLGSFPALGGSPGEGKGYPLQVFWPGEFRGLYIYSPWGCKESDTTEQLSLHCVVFSQQGFCSVFLDDTEHFYCLGKIVGKSISFLFYGVLYVHHNFRDALTSL